MENTKDLQNLIDLLKRENQNLKSLLDNAGISYKIFDGSSYKNQYDPNQGAHLWIFFQKPIEAALARKFGNALLRKGRKQCVYR